MSIGEPVHYRGADPGYGADAATNPGPGWARNYPADCCTNHEACCKEGAACCAKECKSADGTACAMNKDNKACNHDTGCTKSCCATKTAKK